MLTCFPGWTWEYIDREMTIPRVLAITRYQKANPPIHVLVAGYMGVGAASKRPRLDQASAPLVPLVEPNPLDAFPQNRSNACPVIPGRPLSNG